MNHAVASGCGAASVPGKPDSMTPVTGRYGEIIKNFNIKSKLRLTGLSIKIRGRHHQGMFCIQNMPPG